MAIKYLLDQTGKLRNRHFFLIDIVVVLFSPLITLYISLDWHIDFSIYLLPIIAATILFTIIKLTIFYFFGLYRSFWKKASIDDLAKLIFITLNTILLQYIIFTILKNLSFKWLELGILPRYFSIIDCFIALAFVAISRFSIRLSQRSVERLYLVKNFQSANTLIVGAGDAGVSMAEELQRHPQVGLIPVAFVDDNREKHGYRIRGIEVKGGRNLIPEIVKKYAVKKILIAMPSAPGLTIREIMEICRQVNVETFTMPGLFEMVGGKVTIDHIRKIEIEDLLRRESIKTNIEKVSNFLSGKKVLITGAGGSIGSELCRQIINVCPSEILLLGHGENSIFEIDYELKERISKINSPGQNIKLRCRIADLRFIDRLENVFEEFKPDVVIHAAAHKHVPLMEENPSEAITNNVLGTKNLVDVSLKFNVKNFVLISTDKAVNPTSIMGASKRLAEMIVHNAAVNSGYCYCAVRFGNVLGSRGSVVKTFKKQLEKGGPLTVTHPDIIRYLITIPEAVQLVLQASVLGKGGEIFMLDMGKPIKIIDLAKDLIKLSGLIEGKDIKIVFTGLRPGEKLFEELFVDGENYEKTVHEKIFIARNSSELVVDNLIPRIDYLIKSAQTGDKSEILLGLMNLLPEYSPGKNHLDGIDRMTPSGQSLFSLSLEKKVSLF
ncbi:MAG: nucleoside-diphosphate sugar epimerase/dehydratase [Ignavibacteriaceae bacterium]|nr:nucleoside-diphosphate sugar epimerase/dehydratase [Ignavibacteriaceae bacterium]